MIFLLVPIAILLSALLYQSAGAVRDRRVYPPPGRILTVGHTKLHLHEQGQGSPVVVFESGIGASSLSWVVLQPKVAAFTRTVSYDRAGLGWSALSRIPRTVPAMVEELHLLLSRANVSPPYILVGHSFGGLLVRAYASIHPKEIAGLVLVDPVSIAAWANCSETERKRLGLGATLSTRGAWAARFGLVRAALAILVRGGRWFPKLAARMSGSQGTTAMTNLVGEVRKLPPEYWPAVRSHWSDPRCFRALAGYRNCLPESARYAAQMRLAERIPIIILSASTASQQELQERDRWIAESGIGRHIHVPDSGHWLHLDHPELVVEAVRDLIHLAQRHG